MGNNIKTDTTANKNSDEILSTPFGVFNLSQSTGAVFKVSGNELRKTPGNSLAEALRGRVPGLKVTRGNNTPGEDGGYTFTLNGGTPYVLIDGEPRGLEVDLREVEEVYVLNDATFNSMLGILGDNGLIYVVTKGENASKPIVEANYQRGLNIRTRLPQLLSAADYATAINQASNNDGFGDIYSPTAIQAYRDGSDPIRYPNVNYQDMFLKQSSPSNFASLNVYGGKDNVKYGAFLGYSDWQGLEKIGKQINGHDLTFRTKIRTRMNDLIEAHASVYGKFGQNDRAVLAPNTMFNWISTTPANAFPLQVGDTAYVVSNQYNNNLLSELKGGGKHTDYDARMIFDFGVDFDFKDYVKGLKYTTYAMLRTFNSQTLLADNTPATYTINYVPDVNGNDSLTLRTYNTAIRQLNVSRSSSGIQRNFVYGGNVSYVKTIGQGDLNLNLNHLLYFQPTKASGQPDVRQLTFNLNGSYALKRKYIVFGNVNSSSSSKFIGANRTRFFPTGGLAWVVSNEDFLKNNSSINFLKFRTSYGVIGTEYATSNFLYLNQWTGGNTIYYGIGGSSPANSAYSLSQTANLGINWITYNQFYAGAELRMFNSFNLNINYFDIAIKGQIAQASELYAAALGNNVYLPYLNFTNRRNKGFNANISYNNNKNEFKYYVGVNAGYNKITGERIAELPYPDQYRLQQGQPEDNIIGYVSDGLFTAQNIGSALPQFGAVQIGDIKYKDLNGDNKIDSRDQKAIGNNTPRFNYGINIGANFKNFNIDVVGNGLAGYDINLNRNYYQNFGLGSYFATVNQNLSNGNANPRLAVLKSNNNYINSDYWLIKGDYFRISLLELGYTLSDKVIAKGPLNSVKFFVRGSNIALFSKMKDLDPEDLNAGVSEYPMMRTYTLGASLSF
ncbi:SusC/RagA family TonB-linked outer membrane protein [Pedobacter sp. SD-b]|uniref:SusC/RagA family TonB-linked outer membrane protein n=2 Tax=Pedobacter segetis TaxID=2793069 RepID=A0ABS1BMQ6_9SPHI|nr:SusC/RagA family TonB-linked outer membrane protein [Pedobacter segetis]